jgi:hypothetical protein
MSHWTNYHMCVDIEGALRGDNRILRCFTDNGKRVSVAAARKHLQALLAKGDKVMPMGKCDNFDVLSGCKGHPSPQRVQRKRVKGWRKPKDCVNCARPGPWGNPYRVKWSAAGTRIIRAGRLVGRWHDHREALRQVVALFRNALLIGDLPFTAEQVRALKGKDLMCYCALCPKHADGKRWNEECDDCAPCHVDILLAVAQGDQ